MEEFWNKIIAKVIEYTYILLYLKQSWRCTLYLTQQILYNQCLHKFIIPLVLECWIQVLQNKTDTAGGFKWRLAKGHVSGVGNDSASGVADDDDDDEVGKKEKRNHMQYMINIICRRNCIYLTSYACDKPPYLSINIPIILSYFLTVSYLILRTRQRKKTVGNWNCQIRAKVGTIVMEALSEIIK